LILKEAEIHHDGLFGREIKKDQYQPLYIKEEIKAEAPVRNLPGFVRFLPVAALFHAQVLNISVAARDAEIKHTTLNGYFEGWLATLLKAYARHRNLFDEFYYWSPAHSRTTEVDFLLRRGNEFLALEAKCTNRLQDTHLKGLKAITGLDGLKKKILIYTGERRMKTPDDIEIWPLSHFLDILAGNILW